MSKRIVFAAVMAAFIAADLNAAGLFGRNPSKRRATPANLSKLRRIMKSPEKLTELYGPSILIRESKTDAPQGSEFVTQPD